MMDNFNKYINNLFNSKFTILFILVLSYIIVIPNIDRTSFWIDEMYSVYSVTTNSLSNMFNQYIYTDVHPPLYQIFLYFWSRVTSISDFNIRVLSYIFILISLLISYYLLEKYFSRRLAIIFISLSAFTPSILYYGQEARSYALLYSISNILSIIFLIFYNDIKNKKDLSNSLLFSYLILGILVCYTHFFGYILIFSLSIYLLVYSYLENNRSKFLKIFVVSSIIAIFAILWLYIVFIYSNILNKTDGNFWIENDYVGLVKGFIGILFGNPISLILAIIVFISIIIPLKKSIIIIKNNIFILIPIILSIIVAILISLKTPILTNRNLLIIVPLILIFISIIFNHLFDEKRGLISVYIILLLSASIYKNFTYQKEDWRGASNYIKDNFSKNCKVPTSFDRDITPILYTKFYLKDDFEYILDKAVVQENCDLIYFNGHISLTKIEDTLSENNISLEYKILDFNNVYIVIKK